MRKAKVVESTVLMLNMKDGSKKKLTIPADWKVTFGALQPGTDRFSGTALRLYKGSTQKGVFTEVESFRDMSIGIEEEVTRSQEETFYKDDEAGNKKSFIVTGAVREWINPDAPSKPSSGDILRLPNNLKEMPK